MHLHSLRIPNDGAPAENTQAKGDESEVDSDEDDDDWYWGARFVKAPANLPAVRPSTSVKVVCFDIFGTLAVSGFIHSNNKLKIDFLANRIAKAI